MHQAMPSIPLLIFPPESERSLNSQLDATEPDMGPVQYTDCIHEVSGVSFVVLQVNVGAAIRHAKLLTISRV